MQELKRIYLSYLFIIGSIIETNMMCLNSLIILKKICHFLKKIVYHPNLYSNDLFYILISNIIQIFNEFTYLIFI